MPNQHRYKLVRPRSDIASQLPRGSDSVNPALERYLHLISTPPEFSESEWNLLRDACNGWATEMEPAEMLKSGLALQVSAAIALDKKWAVDGDALVQRLEGLSDLEAIATIYAVEVWWSRSRAGLESH